MEPRRLREEGATGVQRALLDSAGADAPAEGAALRMLAALQGLPAIADDTGAPPGDAPAPAASGVESAVAAQGIHVGAMAKVGLVGLVGLGVVGAGLLGHRLIRPPAIPAGAAAVRTRAAPEVRPAEPDVVSPAASEPSVAPERLPGAVRAQETSPPEPSLSSEIRILDVARAAVDEHRPAAAQRALDSYARRFPQGRMRPEAAVLGLAVLAEQGRRAEARSLADQLLASPPYRAYEPRIRSLLRELGKEQTGP